MNEKVKKFKKSIRRLSMQEAPLSPGCIAVCFDEDENGKPLSELIEEITQSTSIEEAAKNAQILELKYWFNITITSEVNEESLQDLRYAFKVLDEASMKYRLESEKDPLKQVKEKAKRASINLHMKGLYETGEYSGEFDTCCLDLSETSVEDVEKYLIFVVGISQRMQPTAFVISPELANKLNDKDYAETTCGKTFNAKIPYKNVFSPKEGLENDFVRELS